MKFTLGLLSTGFGKTSGLGKSENLPGLCPELPNQENFQIERYLGQWFSHFTNDDKHIPPEVRCTGQNIRATGLDDTVIVVNTSIDEKKNTFNFAEGTATQAFELPNQLFVQFAETGSCDSYDQYSNDRNNCNINQLPPKPEIINNYQVLKTDYENYTLVVSCQNIDESSHREVIYMLNRNTCWPYQNKDFVELQIDFLEELGLYVDNLRFVRQENCDDGIGRPDCDANLEVKNDTINEISETFDFEDIIINIEEFL